MKGTIKSLKHSAKHRILRQLPKPLKPYARLAYFMLASPFGGRRRVNKLKSQISLGKTERINFVPPTFSISINSTCNLRCPNCYYVLLGGEHAFEGGGMIKVEDFKAIIDKYGDYIEQVSLTGGEALAHPRLDQLVDILKAKGIKAYVSTNGVFIDRKIETLKSIDYVNVSLDGYDYDSFKKYRGGSNSEFDKIIQGLDLLRENNIAFGNSFVLSEENVHEVNFMLEFATETRPSLVTFHNINPLGCEDFTPLIASSERVQQMLSETTSRNDYPFDVGLPVILDPKSNAFASHACPQQWTMACFNDKGHMAYCCYLDFEPAIGNMFEGYDFNSENMMNFRKRMIEHEYPKDSCGSCQQRFMGQEYGYFHASQGNWVLQGIAGHGKKVIPLVRSASV